MKTIFSERKSPRAKWHDYNGAEYFVTICTKRQAHYYGEIINGEMFLKGLHISKYEMGNIFNHDPDRFKKLLLNKHEIIRLNTKKQKDGFTIIPLRVIIKNGLAKVVIGLAKGKKLYDKREELKKSDQLRYIEKSSKQGY